MRKFCLLCIMAAVLVLMACDSPTSEPEPAVTILLNTASVTMGYNAKASLFAFATVEKGLADTITWATSNAAVASLSATTGNSVEISSGATEGSATVTVTVAGKQKTIPVTVKTTEASLSEATWNAADYASVSDGATLGMMTAIFGAGTISKSGGGLKFSGGGNTTKCALKFSLSRSATITIARDDNTERTLVLYNGTKSAECTRSAASSFSYDYTSSGTTEDFYIYSAGSGIIIYSVTIAYTTSDRETIVYPASLALNATTLTLGDSTTMATLTATIANAAAVTSGYETITWFSSDASVAEVNANGVISAKKEGTTTIYATTKNGLVATCAVTVSGFSTNSIRATDMPTGYAGENWVPFYDANKVRTVTTKAELVEYARRGGWTIYVSGTIDMTDNGSGTMLPTTNYDAAPAALDNFVNTNTNGAYPTYAAWKNAYGNVSTSVDDSSSSHASSYYDALWKLNKAYANIITLSVEKNTAIIGLPDASGNAPVIKGGRFSVAKSHIILRNLVIQDACDPFTHHEANDGFNAQFDNISVSGADHVWIDHCTLEDTMRLVSAKNGEKWQVYDGLCDINAGSTYVTVSYCILRNHDKTMLIGSGSSDTSGGFITLANNRFYGCGQRLPLTCYKNMHIYNNYYGDTSGFYSTSYAIGARYAAYTIVAEGNYFGSGISAAFKASTSPTGTCYASGNSTTSGGLAIASTKPFEVPYQYALLSYSEAKSLVSENAGAGVWSVEQ